MTSIERILSISAAAIAFAIRGVDGSRFKNAMAFETVVCGSWLRLS
jgi:hypothetical protein